MKIKWIKISTDMFDDEKISIISSMPEANAMLVIWIRLLALAGKTNDGGSIYFDEGIPYTDEMLSTIFRQPLNVVRLSLQTFEKFRMIERHEDQIYITNWEKHQNIEGMEKIRLLNAERVRKHRERKQIGECNVTVTNCNALDKNRLDKKEIKNKETTALHPLSEAWNTNCGELPKVLSLSKSRIEKIRVRLSERPLEGWVDIFKKVSSSSFCTGQNDRKWVATFDWLIDNDHNALKVLEGKYDDRTAPKSKLEMLKERLKCEN